MHVPTLVAALAIVVVATAIFGYIAQRLGLVSRLRNPSVE